MEHSTARDRDELNRLKASLRPDESPTGDLMDLAHLCVEPFHREDEAIKLFEAIVRREPYDFEAKLWLAYCYVHFLMDEKAQLLAVGLLSEIIEASPELKGAALMLLAEAREDLKQIDLSQTTELLEASVSYEPNWVYNRLRLAYAYEKAGRGTDALLQLKQALKNVCPVDPEAPARVRNFEVSITGRASHHIDEQLNARIRAASVG